MKTLVRSVLMAGAFAVAVGVMPASAQIYEPITFRTTFPFTVGRATLPAGSYTVRPALDGQVGLLQIRGEHGSALFFADNTGTPRGDAKETVAVFNHTGDHYALAQIWDEDTREGADAVTAARPDKAERNQMTSR